MHKISKKEINAAKIHIILSKQDTPSKNDVKIFLWGFGQRLLQLQKSIY